MVLELGLEISDFSIKETLLGLSTLGNFINTDHVAFSQLALVNLVTNVVQQVKNSTKLVGQPIIKNKAKHD